MIDKRELSGVRYYNIINYVPTSNEWLEVMRERYWDNPDSAIRDKISASMTDRWTDEEYRAQMKSKHRELWEDADHREMMLRARNTESFISNSMRNLQKAIEANTGKKRDPSIGRKIGDKLRGGKRPSTTGEGNPMFKGWYVTPWGIFATLREAASSCPYSATSQTVKRWCTDPEFVFRRPGCKRIGLPESWIGLTSRELGFSFDAKYSIAREIN